MLFSLFSEQLYAYTSNQNAGETFIEAFATASSQKLNNRTNPEIYNIKDPQANILGATLVENTDIVYLLFPTAKNISAKQGCDLSYDIKDAVSISSTSLNNTQGHRVKTGIEK